MLLDDVGAYLETAGVGTVKTTSNSPAWPIYLGNVVPGMADAGIFLVEGPGPGPLLEMSGSVGGGIALENPGLQVIVRDATYTSARTKAQAIMLLLHNFSGTLGSPSVRYSWIRANQAPFPSGKDADERYLISCNYSVWKELG